MLLAIDLHKDFIDIKGIAIASMLSLQSFGVEGTELDAPKTDRFAADSNASLRQKIFDIPMAEIKAIVEPDGVRNDIWRESMTLVCVHEPILPIFGGLLGRT